jgi:hypothetical protein
MDKIYTGTAKLEQELYTTDAGGFFVKVVSA